MHVLGFARPKKVENAAESKVFADLWGSSSFVFAKGGNDADIEKSAKKRRKLKECCSEELAQHSQESQKKTEDSNSTPRAPRASDIAKEEPAPRQRFASASPAPRQRLASASTVWRDPARFFGSRRILITPYHKLVYLPPPGALGCPKGSPRDPPWVFP